MSLASAPSHPVNPKRHRLLAWRASAPGPQVALIFLGWLLRYALQPRKAQCLFTKDPPVWLGAQETV